MYHSETAETDADESYQEATDTDEEWLSVGDAEIMPPLILNRGERSDPVFDTMLLPMYEWYLATGCGVFSKHICVFLSFYLLTYIRGIRPTLLTLQVHQS